MLYTIKLSTTLNTVGDRSSFSETVSWTIQEQGDRPKPLFPPCPVIETEFPRVPDQCRRHDS